MIEIGLIISGISVIVFLVGLLFYRKFKKESAWDDSEWNKNNLAAALVVMFFSAITAVGGILVAFVLF